MKEIVMATERDNGSVSVIYKDGSSSLYMTEVKSLGVDKRDRQKILNWIKNNPDKIKIYLYELELREIIGVLGDILVSLKNLMKKNK